MYLERRTLLILGVTSPLLLLGKITTTLAFWPIVIRIIAQGFLGATRGALSNMARGTASRSILRTLAGTEVRRQSMRTIANSAISSGITIAVSPDVYDLVKNYAAEAIWIQNGYENKFEAVLHNESSDSVGSQLYIGVEDVVKKEYEKEQYCGYLSAGPGDTFKFDFKIADLPFPGVKWITARTFDTSIQTVPSGNIVVASAADVAID